MLTGSVRTALTSGSGSDPELSWPDGDRLGRRGWHWSDCSPFGCIQHGMGSPCASTTEISRWQFT